MGNKSAQCDMYCSYDDSWCFLVYSLFYNRMSKVNKNMRKMICVIVAIMLILTAIPVYNVQSNANISKPKLVSVTETTGAKVLIKWKKVREAKGYIVYRKTGKSGKYKKITTIKKNSTVTYTDYKTKDNTIYYYSVKAVKGNKKSLSSNEKKIKTGKSPKIGNIDVSHIGILIDFSTKIRFTTHVENPVRIKENSLGIYYKSKLVGLLTDDGKNGDEHANDQIYSCEIEVMPSAIGQREYKLCYGKKEVDSVAVRVFDMPSEEDYLEVDGLNKIFSAIESEYLEENFVNSKDVNLVIDEVYNRAEQLKQNGSALYVDKNEYGVTIQLSSGLWYAYLPKVEGVENNGDDINMSIWTLQPCYDSLPTDVFDNVAENITSKLANCSFPINADNTVVTREMISNFGKNQVIIWNGHGGYNDKLGSYSVLGESTGELKNGTLFLDTETYRKYIAGEYVFSGGKVCVTSKYVTNNIGAMDNSFIYLGTCLGAKDDKLMNAYVSKGATILAFSDTVLASYDRAVGAKLFATLTEINEKSLQYYSLLEALEITKAEVGENDSIGKFNGKGASPVIKGNLSFRLSNQALASLFLDKSEESIKVGESIDILLTTNIKDETNINWTISDSSIATLTKKDGRHVTVTAQKPGLTIVKCSIGNKSAICIVSVQEQEKISIIDGSYWSIHIGQKAREYKNADTTYFESAKIEGDTLYITGKLRDESNENIGYDQWKLKISSTCIFEWSYTGPDSLLKVLNKKNNIEQFNYLFDNLEYNYATIENMYIKEGKVVLLECSYYNEP